MDYVSIGRKIADGRNRKKLTQEDLAEKINSNAGYISNIEAAKKKPSLRMLINIVNVLDISLDYLLVNEIGYTSSDGYTWYMVDKNGENGFYVFQSFNDKVV